MDQRVPDRHFLHPSFGAFRLFTDYPQDLNATSKDWLLPVISVAYFPGVAFDECDALIKNFSRQPLFCVDLPEKKATPKGVACSPTAGLLPLADFYRFTPFWTENDRILNPNRISVKSRICFGEPSVCLVDEAGFEPAIREEVDPKSTAYANSATRPLP